MITDRPAVQALVFTGRVIEAEDLVQGSKVTRIITTTRTGTLSITSSTARVVITIRAINSNSSSQDIRVIRSS